MATSATNGGQTAAAATAPQLNVLAQYIKDFSFENPNAPRSLQPTQQQPQINIQINVNAQPLGDTDVERRDQPWSRVLRLRVDDQRDEPALGVFREERAGQDLDRGQFRRRGDRARADRRLELGYLCHGEQRIGLTAREEECATRTG